MKDKITMDYNSVSKRYEVSINNDEIGQIYRNGKQYQTYYQNDYIGDYSNPYSAKEEILNKHYPMRKAEKEKGKQERAEHKVEKEKQEQIKREQETKEHDEIVRKMNLIRDNEIFRNNFYNAFIKIDSEHADLSKEEIFSGTRVWMNGIALFFVYGMDEINKAMNRNNLDSKVLKIFEQNKAIEQILNLCKVA